MIAAKDRFVSQVAITALTVVVDRKLKKHPSENAICDFLNSKKDGQFARQRGDICSVWTRARTSTVELHNTAKMEWQWNATRRQFEINVPATEQQPNIVRVHPVAASHLPGILKGAVRNFYLEGLKNKPDQGKVFDIS